MDPPLGKLHRQTFTRSRKDRPCDLCRKRKTRCVKDGTRLCQNCRRHSLDCTYDQAPAKRAKHVRHEQQQMDQLEQSRQQAATIPITSPPPSNKSFVNSSPISSFISNPLTLALSEGWCAEYIGPSYAQQEVMVIARLAGANGEYHISPNTKLRRVSHDVAFFMTRDQQKVEDLQLINEIGKLVPREYGDRLINLYFRMVHPSFPIIHKASFMEKYNQTPQSNWPALLAAIYSVALNWWSYDPDLRDIAPPDAVPLDRLALDGIYQNLHRSRLSTIQAGLLLLQRKIESPTITLFRGNIQTWAFTAQLVAVAQSLGLHLDCGNWDIPKWEKILRTRLSWAVYMQDKWTAFGHGRPSHISDDWLPYEMSILDFDDSSMGIIDITSPSSEYTSIAFLELIHLSVILSDILQSFYSSSSLVAQNIQDVLKQAKPIQLRLRELFARLPDYLHIDAASAQGLYLNGYLHLAYFATEIALHKALIQRIDEKTDQDVVIHCRNAAHTRALAATQFIASLRVEHLEAFWVHNARNNIVVIGSFIGLLQATSHTQDEAKYYNDLREKFRWHLRVHSRATWLMGYALNKLEESIWGAVERVPLPISTEHFSPPQAAPDNASSEDALWSTIFQIEDWSPSGLNHV